MSKSALPKKKAKIILKSPIDTLLYGIVEAIVKAASNDGLSVLRSKDKEGDKEYVQGILQEMWESADDWFV